jgi:hypothetical protein
MASNSGVFIGALPVTLTWYIIQEVGRLAQWESAVFTRQRSLVRDQHRLPFYTLYGIDCSTIVARVQNIDTRPQTFRAMVCIPHRHCDRLMAQQLLHLVKIDTGLNQHCSKGMSQIMETDILKPRFFPCKIESPEKVSCMNLSSCLRCKDKTGDMSHRSLCPQKLQNGLIKGNSPFIPVFRHQERYRALNRST